MNIQELCNKYKVKHQRYEMYRRAIKKELVAINTKLDRLEKKKATLYKKERSLMYPKWAVEIVEPISQELKKRLPDYVVITTLGIIEEQTCGIFCTRISEKTESCLSIVFVPIDLENGVIAIRDHTVNTHEYPDGSACAINGLNHPDIPIPQDADIEWLLKHAS